MRVKRFELVTQKNRERIEYMSRKIAPSDEVLTYSGRIDFEKKDEPVFVFPCSSFCFATDASKGKISVENIHSYGENSLGVLVDGIYKGKVILPDEGSIDIDISAFLDGSMHDITIFKRQDGCHYVIFRGLTVNDGAKVEKVKEIPRRRIEVYGDSVSAGEVSEAVAYAGLQDPEHMGEYSNSYYSYSWMAARKLNAQIHDIAQGGIALMDGQGYFADPIFVGMLSSYDKIQYNPQLGETKDWDFAQYTPHVVVVAIGQNDANPKNYMAEDYDGEEARIWRENYRGFILKLREKYPKATFVLTTTILNHDSGWDNAIDEVTKSFAGEDDKIHHFLYTKNGCGTHGHIRIPEAEKMAEELAAFIESLGEEVWAD